MSMDIDVRSALRNASLECKKCENTGFMKIFIADDGTLLKEWAVRCETAVMLCQCQKRIYETFGVPTDETKRERYNREA